MKKTYNICLNIINILICIIFSIITIGGIFFNKYKPDVNIGILLVGIAGYLIFLFTVKCIIKKIDLKYLKILFLIVLVCCFVFQIICGIKLKVNPSWDFGAVNDIASKLSISEIFNDWYFTRYPNNLGITIILYCFFKLASLFEITNFINVGIILNIVFIDLAVFFTYLVSKKIFNERKAIFVTLMLLFLTPIYLYVPIYYTDTLSMLFPILLIYLYLLRKKDTNNIVLNVVIGIILFIGINIKFTVLITYIAICILEIINIFKYRKEYIKRNLIKKNMNLCIILFTLILLTIFKNQVIYYFNHEYKDQLFKEQFPTEHWIMMGLEKENGYNHESVEFTASFENIIKKRNANFKKIMECLKNNNINFYINKIIYQWGNGTFTADDKLSREPIKINRLSQYILGINGKNIYYRYFSQIQMFSIWILILLSGFNFSKNRYKNNLDIVLKIIIIGLFIFFILWETRTRYLVNYIPIFILLAFDGLQIIKKIYIDILKRSEKI